MARAREFSQDALNVIPEVAPAIEITKNGDGFAQIKAPRPKTRLMRFLCFIFKAPDYRIIVLDETGTEMLDLVDGRRTFGELSECLEKARSLETGPARESMAAFLARLADERVIRLKRGAGGAGAAEDKGV